MIKFFALAVAGFVVLFGGALFIAPASVWSLIGGDPDLGPVQFETLSKTSRPNQFLLCPPGYCRNETPDEEAKVYALPASELKSILEDMLQAETHVEKVAETPTSLRYVARTPLLQYPDTVSIAFLEREAGSTLAIYSRSQIGYSDFGANRNRIEDWLNRLDAQIAAQASSPSQ